MCSVVGFCLSFSKMTTSYIPDLANNQSSLPSLKPHAQAHLLSATDKCKICAEPAARHTHYGARTCFSCRAFFRRSLQNKTAAKYVCMRHSMCEMNIKTRKNCQYCRYMKCLAIGMNPTYVLSEEERNKRFKKRNNSINEEEATEKPFAVEAVVMSVEVNKPEEPFGQKKITEADKEMTKSDINQNKTSDTNEVFQKQAERFDDKSHDLEKVSSTQKHHDFNQGLQHYRNISPPKKNNSYAFGTVLQNHHDFDQGMKHYGNDSPQKKIHFEQNFRSQGQIRYFQPPCHSPPADNYHGRGSIIMRNENKFSRMDVFASKDAFLNRDNKTSVIKEAQVRMSQAEEIKSYVCNEMKPLAQCDTFSKFSATPEIPENLTTKGYASHDNINEGMTFKETQEDQISEIDTSSDSDDEISLKIASAMLCHEPEIIFTEDEKHQLEKLVSDHDTVYHSVNFGEVIIKEMLMCSMFGVPVSTSAAIQGYRLQVERITRIANSLRCFTELKKVDQVTLLKENADLLVSLRGALFFDKKKKGVDQVLSSMGIDDMEIIKKMFKPLIQSHSMNHIDYRIFNSIQDPGNKKTEERYSFLQGKVADAIMDNITTILMTYIILFSSDFCSLEDRKRVERTQHHYLRILERCIYSANSRYTACSRMAHTLNAVTCVREMADIKKSRVINHSAVSQVKT
eukprot:GFUD01051470.1.p1 GENE.GFUD01051470.1~~GFUD01051470.1.p1  ORF type:complete len:682 (-),score=136.96 GFUD01051470.1:677-2722(-)